MSRQYRGFGKADKNQGAIVKALRDIGATVQPLSQVGEGCPDLLVGFRGDIFLLEVKHPKRQILTPDQTDWFVAWNGKPPTIVTDVKSALRAIGAMK